ncbi:MAG TPA: choice-of-anchor D domain-containing protein, partial [Candidatus Kapabacteria bacterium]|nr:choice-of-anchor D domain-containing protein [Candidatus Kapabacteria bacterium]
VATINAGQFYEFHTSDPSQVQTNNPVVLAQYSQSETDNHGNYSGLINITNPWDPTMMVIPPTQQFMTDYIFANAQDVAFTANFVNVVIPDSAVNTLLLDGSAVTTLFVPIAASGYSYAQIPVSQGSHHITAASPFGIYIYGCGPADAYANTGGALFKFLNGLRVSNSIINYGNVKVDSCVDTTVIFRNVGTTAITVWNITLSGSGVPDFTIISGTPPFTLQPGDSQAVTVKFCPTVLGQQDSVQMNVSSNAVEHPIVTLLGAGLAGKLSSAANTLDCDTARDDYGYATLDCKRDTSFVIKNVSNAIVQVDSIGISGPDAADFSILSNTNFSLSPGDSITIVIGFQPTSDGVKSATLQTYSNAIVNVQIALQGIAVSAHIAGLPDTVDFGTVQVNRTRDSVLVVKNTSSFPAELVWGASVGDYYGLTGTDAANFGYLPHNASSPNALVLLPGDSLVLKVSFTPLSSGTKISEMIGAIPICHDSGAYNTGHIAYLKGNGAYATLGINPPVVDYKRVKLGKVKDSTLILRNIGIYTADITQYAITGPDAQDFILMTTTHPDSLTVGSDSLIVVQFAPLSLGQKHAQLVVAGDVSGGSVLADLYGEGTPAKYNVITKTDTIHGRAGDVIQVPVRLLTPLDLADINKYHIVMGYDPTMLYATGVSVDSTWSASGFQPALTYVPGYSDVQAFSPDTTLTGTGTLFYITMNVLLGDAQQTPLNLRFVTYTDNTNDSTAVTSAVEQGLFILDGYCGGQQGTGLLRTAGSYGVSSISPDPVTGSAMVSYQVGNDGHVQLGLYDALGNEVMELVNTDQKAGGYTTPFNASNLSDGAYIMELRSGSHREIKQVVVMK